MLKVKREKSKNRRVIDIKNSLSYVLASIIWGALEKGLGIKSPLDRKLAGRYILVRLNQRLINLADAIACIRARRLCIPSIIC